VAVDSGLDAGLVEGATPAEVLQATGRWLSDRLDAGRFAWRSSRRCLVATAAGRTEEIGFEGDRYNRTGSRIAVRTARLRVSDEGLARWRRAHPHLTVPRPPSVLTIICSSSYLDLTRRHSAVLTDPADRIAAAEALVADLESVAMPWLATTRDADTLPDAVPDALLHLTAFAQDLLEYLVSRNLTDQADTLIRRYRSISPAHQESFTEGRRLARSGRRPDWHTPPAFGWSCEVLGLTGTPRTAS
jgi:hypothetical protein